MNNPQKHNEKPKKQGTQITHCVNQLYKVQKQENLNYSIKVSRGAKQVKTRRAQEDTFWGADHSLFLDPSNNYTGVPCAIH